MNNKLELYNKLLCMGCLCVRINLKKVRKKKYLKFYENSLSGCDLKLPNPLTILSMCVNCFDILKTAVKFQEQIQNTYRVLLTYPDQMAEHLSESTRNPLENTNSDILNDDSKMKMESDFHKIDIVEHEPDVTDSSSEEGSMDVPISSIKREKWDRGLNKNSKTSANDRNLSQQEDELCLLGEEKAFKEEAEESNLDIQIEAFCGNSEVEEKHAMKCRNLERGTKNIQNVYRESADINIQKQLNYIIKDNMEESADAVYTESLVKSLDVLNDNDDDGDKFEDASDRDHMDEINLEDLKQEIKDKEIITKKKIKKSHKKRDKKSNAKKKKNQSFITVDLSPEEMKEERDRKRKNESFLKAEFKCDTCLVKFGYEKSFVEHGKKRHDPSIGDYVCPVCSTIFSTLDTFTSHYKRHMKRYECTICKKRTGDVKVMQQHCYTEHNITSKQYKCGQCSFTTCTINSLRYHKESHKSRIKCKHCDNTFSHRAALMNHTMAFHSGRNSFLCEECGAKFRWKASLRRHADKQHARPGEILPGRAVCLQCDITFSSMSSYQRHLKNSLKHVSPDDLKYICDHCNRRFADKTKLRDHIEEKHLFKTFHCHICNKPSKNRVGLDQHIRNVHKGRPNNKICHYCGKGFPTTVQLESHMRTHTGERPFTCAHCPTTFTQHSNLYKHNRQVHLNIKSKRAPKSKEKAEVIIDTALGQNQQVLVTTVAPYDQNYISIS